MKKFARSAASISGPLATGQSIVRSVPKPSREERRRRERENGGPCDVLERLKPLRPNGFKTENRRMNEFILPCSKMGF